MHNKKAYCIFILFINSLIDLDPSVLFTTVRKLLDLIKTCKTWKVVYNPFLNGPLGIKIAHFVYKGMGLQVMQIGSKNGFDSA